MDNSALVSVIIPVFNTEKYIFECVQSLLDQSYNNLEIILVDDGSTDRCPRICDELAAEHDCIISVHQKNSGSGAARNTGLLYAHGDYVTFVDSDDFESKDCIKNLLKCKHDSIAFTACDFVLFTYESDIRKYRKHIETAPIKIDLETYILNMIKDKYPVSVVNKLYDLNLIKESGIQFDTMYQFWEDLRFNIDYLNAAKTIYKYIMHIPKVMYFTRIRAESQTRLKSISKEKELLRSTQAIWQIIQENTELSREVQNSMSLLYGYYIINYFYTVQFGMKQYNNSIVNYYIETLKSLNCSFKGKTKVKYLLLRYIPRQLFCILKRLAQYM